MADGITVVRDEIFKYCILVPMELHTNKNHKCLLENTVKWTRETTTRSYEMDSSQ